MSTLNRCDKIIILLSKPTYKLFEVIGRLKEDYKNILDSHNVETIQKYLISFFRTTFDIELLYM